MKSNKKRKSYRGNNSENDRSSSKDIFEEFQLQEQESQTQFNILEYIYKKECTSYSFGKVLIEQKAYYCSVCKIFLSLRCNKKTFSGKKYYIK